MYSTYTYMFIVYDISYCFYWLSSAYSLYLPLLHITFPSGIDKVSIFVYYIFNSPNI